MCENKVSSFRDEYKFLSNFARCNVEYEGVVYPTVEHAFQAAKTFDVEERMKICANNNPVMAKRIGKRVKLREDWDDVKVSIMKELVVKKFENKELRELLLNTGDMYLEEGNKWHDTFWGVCNGKGENNLGKILMEVREEIRNSDK